jgi:hypothetical protein
LPVLENNIQQQYGNHRIQVKPKPKAKKQLKNIDLGKMQMRIFAFEIFEERVIKKRFLKGPDQNQKQYQE